MDARFSSRGGAWISLAMLALFCWAAPVGHAAGFRTQNFIVQADTAGLARAVGQAAEQYRDQLAHYWIGHTLPPWSHPCPIRVVAGPHLAAQGVTTYNRAPVRDFQMEVVGTPERILDSVLPHEVTHTVLATHFGRPLPRWADEGICTTVEHVSERNKHEAKLREFLHTRRGIAMNQLFLLTEYPSDVLPMYAQGYSVCRFLIEQDSAAKFIRFLEDYMRNPSWTANVRKHYGYESLAELQDYWLAWVREGSGPVQRFAKVTRPDPNVQPAGYATLPAPKRSDLAQASIPQTSPARTPFTSPGSNALVPAGKLATADLSPPRSRAVTAALGSAALGSGASGSGASGSGASGSGASGSGWYQRQRDQAGQTNLAAGTAEEIPTPPAARVASAAAKQFPPITPMVPPSVRNSGRYSAAQPQPEQGARGSFRKIPLLDWADRTPRYR